MEYYTTYPKTPEKRAGTPQLLVAHVRTHGNPLRGHVTDVITGEKARLGQILHNFRLRMHAPKGTPSGSRDLWSLPGAMGTLVLHFVLL